MFNIEGVTFQKKIKFEKKKIQEIRIQKIGVGLKQLINKD